MPNSTQNILVSITAMLVSASIAVVAANSINKKTENPYNKQIRWIYLPLFFAVVGFSLSYRIYGNINTIFAYIELMFGYFALIVAVIWDYKIKLIPNYISLSLIITRILIFFVEWVLSGMDVAVAYIITALIGGMASLCVLIICNKLSKGGIGYGDIKIFASLGFMCGFYAVASTLVFAMLSCTVSIIALLVAKKKKVKDEIVFAPFIYIGYSLCLLFMLY